MSHATGADARSLSDGQRLFIGTSDPSASGGNGEGVFTATFRAGVLSQPRRALAATSPSFLAVPPGKHTPMFAVLGGDAGSNDIAASYATSASDEPTMQTMLPISRADAGGTGSCHVSVSPDGHTILVANYSGGSVASFRADDAGRLTQASFVQFPPDTHGPVIDRQEKAHAHSALVSPDGGYVLVNDLGLDRVHVFRLDRATSKLLPHTPGHWASAPGAGPRHLVFHPNGRWIYNINELNSTIDQLEWDPASGVLTTRSTVRTLPKDVSADGKRACEMVFSRDLRFLYACNRVHESFAVFTVDPATGALRLLQELPNPGKEARHIAVDPSGKWLLSANQFSGDVSVFPLDTASGRLGPRASRVDVAGASCLLFA